MVDDLAFEQFVRARATELLRAAVLLTGSRELGEELLQDTFAHLYPLWDKVTGADAPVAYVRRVLVNRFISSSRRRHRDISVWEPPDRWDGRDLGQTVSLRRSIWQLMAGLSTRERAAIVLRYYHDQSDAQIAQALGCREGTVRSLLSRAITQLKHALPAEAQDMAGWL